MMCQSTGLPPISTIGFGLIDVSSLMRVPSPPARITAFMELPLNFQQDSLAPKTDRKKLKVICTNNRIDLLLNQKQGFGFCKQQAVDHD